MSALKPGRFFRPSDLLKFQQAPKPMDYTLQRANRPDATMRSPGQTPFGFQLMDALLGTSLRPTSRMLGGMSAPANPLSLLRAGRMPQGQDYDSLLQQLELMRQRG